MMGDLELDLDGTRVRGKCQAKGSEGQLAAKSTRLKYFGGKRRRNEMKKGAKSRKST